MMKPASLFLLATQLLGLAVFFAVIYPWLKKENWKAKFWDNLHARGLMIVFAIIFVSIIIFRFLMDWLVPVEVLP